MCNVLKEIYRKVYDEGFDYSSIDCRIKLQKAVYILENMGVHVGDYSFSWDKYGPYSLGLDADAYSCNKMVERPVAFSTFAENRIEKVKNLIVQNTEYTVVNWVECIASLHYLSHVLRFKGDKLLLELEERKPYLSNREINRQAMSMLKEIRVGV